MPSFCFQKVIPAPGTTPSLTLAQIFVKLCWHKQPHSDLTRETALDSKQPCKKEGGTAAFDSSVGLYSLTLCNHLETTCRRCTQEKLVVMGTRKASRFKTG